jgi:hypothetical protein
VFVAATGLSWAIEDTGGVSENLRAGLETGGRRLPAASQPGVEEGPVRRFRGPDGDRRHGAESGGVEDEVARRGEGEAHVVSVLVLGEDFVDVARWAEAPPPAKNPFESGQGSEGLGESGALCRRKLGVVNEFDGDAGLPQGSRR